MCKSKLHTPSVLKTETSHQLSGFFEHSEFLRDSLFVFFLLGFFPIAFPNSDFKEGENRPGARQTYHKKRDLSKKKTQNYDASRDVVANAANVSNVANVNVF